MSLMSGLYVGVSGLQVSQNALNSSSHNLANVETEGYVRQQTVLQTSLFKTVGQSHISAMQTGLGVSTQTVRQVRDQFLDRSYRMESGRQGFYDSQYETINEIENMMGELNGVAFQDTMEEFWINIQELAKEPDSLVKRASLIQTSVSFIERTESIYTQLSQYQLNLNTKVRNYVNRINEIGDQISDLNDKICFYESNQVENANDLRDTRNSLLDELGQMISISYRETATGRVTVNAEGMPFVTEDAIMHMDSMTVTEHRKLLAAKNGQVEEEEEDAEETSSMEDSDMLVPVWPTFGYCEVYDRNLIPSTASDTDIGGLKGLIIARGTKIAKFIDIPIAPKEEEYLDEDGKLKEDAYKEVVDKYNRAVDVYNIKIEPSIVMTAQAQFDQLIHGVVTTLNNIFSPLKEVTVPAGTQITKADGSIYIYDEDTKIRILDRENAPIGQDGPPGTMGEELFSRKSMSRFIPAQEENLVTTDGETIEGAWIYNEEDATNNYSLYTMGELKVNESVINNKSILPLSSNTNTGDYDVRTTESLLDAWNTPFATLDPNTLTKNNFSDYYNCYIGNVATRGEKMRTVADSQAGMVQSIGSQRSSVLGVSSDEELTDIIKYQHAYNAAARYVNVIDEMLEHIVTRL